MRIHTYNSTIRIGAVRRAVAASGSRAGEPFFSPLMMHVPQAYACAQSHGFVFIVDTGGGCGGGGGGGGCVAGGGFGGVGALYALAWDRFCG